MFFLLRDDTRKIDPVRYLVIFKWKNGLCTCGPAVGQTHCYLNSRPIWYEAPSNIKRVDVISADEMCEAVHEHVDSSSIFISTAAVADFNGIKDQKIKKSTGHKELSLNLVENNDIIRVFKL